MQGCDGVEEQILRRQPVRRQPGRRRCRKVQPLADAMLVRLRVLIAEIKGKKIREPISHVVGEEAAQRFERRIIGEFAGGAAG